MIPANVAPPPTPAMPMETTVMVRTITRKKPGVMVRPTVGSTMTTSIAG